MIDTKNSSTMNPNSNLSFEQVLPDAMTNGTTTNNSQRLSKPAKNTRSVEIGESTARLHHLEEHGDRDSYRAHRCFDCGSDQHASGTCEQTAFLLSFQLSNAI